MPEVTAGQLLILSLTALLMALSEAAQIARIKWDRARTRLVSRWSFVGAIVLGMVLLAWHAFSRGRWMPLGDNFEALVWLALLLALFVAYVQKTRPVGGLDWFVMPIVVLLLVGAAVFGRANPHEYVATTWSAVHRLTAYASAAAFAVAGATGMLYLIADRRLKNKAKRKPGPARTRLGSLERLESLTLRAVTLGFALMTIGLITGLVKLASDGTHTALGAHWYVNPKILFAAGSWVIFGLVLHSPINPSFRGKRAAVLSVVGFVLMVFTVLAVQVMPAPAPGSSAAPADSGVKP